MSYTAVPVAWRRRHFGIVILDEAGEVELAVVAGRLSRPVPLDRWQHLLATCTGVDFEGIPEERFRRLAWFFEAGTALIDECGGGWRNRPQRLDELEGEPDELVAGEPIALFEEDEELRPVVR